MGIRNARKRQEVCHGCEERPIRDHGEYVTRVEAWVDRRLYCHECADEWENGEEVDPDAA